MFVSCPELCERIFSSEGKYPVHLVPEPWTIYLQKRDKKRGLFFMDGEEWWEARRQLNPLLLKHPNLKRMQPVIEIEIERKKIVKNTKWLLQLFHLDMVHVAAKDEGWLRCS